MFKNNNIQTRILIFTSSILLLVILSLSLIFYFNTRTQTYEEKKNVIALEVEREKVFIERQFSKLYEDTQTLSIAVEHLTQLSNQDDLRQYLINVSGDFIQNNDFITGVDFIFEKNVIEDDSGFVDDTRFQYDGQFITRITVSGEDYIANYIENYDTKQYYLDAVATKTNFFTDPYTIFINSQRTLISTICFPIVINGNYLGLVGVDFITDSILSNALEFTSTYPRRDIIVSEHGDILLNTADSTSVGANISTIHPLYLEGMVEVDQNGQRIGISEFGNLEVLYKIELGSSGQNWYIFSDVAMNQLFTDINRASFQILYIGLIMLALTVLFTYLINIRVTKPITSLTNAVNEFDVKKSNFEVFDIKTDKLKDIKLLRDSYVNGYKIVQKNLAALEKRTMLKETQINLRMALESHQKIEELSNTIIKEVVEITDGLIGVIYLKDDFDNYVLSGSFGVSKDINVRYKDNEGLIGKVALSKKIEIIKNVESIDPKVDFGIKEISPPNILLIPITDNKTTIAIIEVVSIKEFDEKTIEKMLAINDLIKTEIIRQLSIEKTEKLLIETEKLARELEINKSDLEQKNEELISQQEELRVTNEELQTQQEELRIANQELQSNMIQMEKINNELKNTQEELNIRTLEAEQSNQYKSQFLANMSHELRTPLNSILILSSLISENEKIDSKLREFAKTINSSGKDLLELINGILDLSKIESGQDELNIAKVDFNEIYTTLEKRFVPVAKNKKINFIINKEDKKFELFNDQKKIQIILNNLISNAIKFTKKGSVSLTVTHSQKDISFIIKDTGIGIEEQNLDKIFEEFKQVDDKTNRAFGGSGLGLSISKSYAKMIGGKLSVESKINEGSVFTLTIFKDSFNKIQSVKLEKTPTKLKGKSSVFDQGIIKDDRDKIQPNEKAILVIDDDINFLYSMKSYFNSLDIKVLVANTGENGLFLADYYSPSVIIIDISLPNRNGVEIYKKFNDNFKTRHIKKILISGVENQKEISLPFFKKPISDKDMHTIIEFYKNTAVNKPKVLLAEDNEIHRKAIEEYILANEKINIDIDYVMNKKEVLNMLGQKNYSLLVMDLALADSDNFDLIEEIRKDNKYNETPIVVYTGKVFSKAEENKLRTLVQDIIIKGDKSPQRLLDDIELFIYGRKNHNLTIDKIIFEDKTVLIVDDDIRNVFALTGLLEKYNIHVEYVTSGKDAVNFVKENFKNINLVLMDIMMPEMDGFETMQIIRNDLKIKDLPIIALTAKTMKGDREKCISSGADEYLSKPLNNEKLLSVLRVWLQ